MSSVSVSCGCHRGSVQKSYFITEIFAKRHKDIMVPLQCDRCVEGDGVIIAKCQIVEVNNNIEYVATYR